MLTQVISCFCSRTASKKVVHKKAEATRESVEKKIADKIVKPKPAPDENPINVEEIVIQPEKRDDILNELKQVL